MSEIDPAIALFVSNKVEECREYADKKAEAARTGATDTLKLAFGILGGLGIILTLFAVFGLGPLVKAKVDAALANADAAAVLKRLEVEAKEVSELKKSVFADKSFGGVPVGSIVAFHKNIVNDPDLKLPPDESWIECTNPDGKKMVTIDFGDNVKREVIVPHLNHEGGRFLRGGMRSGVFQQASGVPVVGEVGAGNDMYVGNWKSGVNGYFEDVDSSDPPVAPGRATLNVDYKEPNGGNDRPSRVRVRATNMSVIWIMRVK